MISEETAMEVWKKALTYILEEGEDFIDQNNRMSKQALNLTMEIKRPDIKITEPIELLNSFKTWKYPKLDEIANIMLSSKLSLDYAYSYGPRLFNYQGVKNQIDDYIIPLLRKNPNTRRAIAVLWDPSSDTDMIKSEVPGLIYLDFKIVNNKLNMTGTIRSNDIFFGWPANIYQLFVMQNYVRKKLDVDIGSLTVFSVSAHIFKEEFEIIKKII
jgi:thymidylate synthase